MKDCYVELRHSKTKRLLSIEGINCIVYNSCIHGVELYYHTAKVVSKGQEDTWPNFCVRNNYISCVHNYNINAHACSLDWWKGIQHMITWKFSS